MHENFARSLASSLSAYLRAYVIVNLVSVEQISFRELTQCLVGTNLLSLAISPDGRTMAISGEERSISLWELPSGRALARWPAHDAPVRALTFSPDGATLVSGADDGTMKLWNLPFIRKELSVLGLDW